CGSSLCRRSPGADAIAVPLDHPPPRDQALQVSGHREDQVLRCVFAPGAEVSGGTMDEFQRGELLAVREHGLDHAIDALCVRERLIEEDVHGIVLVYRVVRGEQQLRTAVAYSTDRVDIGDGVAV